jgi:hypothetical protein
MKPKVSNGINGKPKSAECFTLNDIREILARHADTNAFPI